jgi:hypothetical protein
MSELLITSDGSQWDLYIGPDGEAVRVTEYGRLVEVTQRVIHRLLTWFAESPYRNQDGLPYEEGIFGEAEVEGVSALFYTEILKVEGVDEIITWEIPDIGEDRTLYITFAIRVGAEITPTPITLEITP